MTHPSKRKGSGFEREIVQHLKARGFAAERVPLSGGAGGSYTGDIAVVIHGAIRKLECKIRTREFSRLYGYLGNNFAVVVRDKRTPPLVIMDLDRWLELIG